MSKPSNFPTESPRPRLALIAGPTASGKSALALALAEGANGVIINADASQVYADLDVLSARPSAAEMARAPHRLFGMRDGARPCSAADWAELAKAEITAAHAAGRLPILVGGTGLYIRTLLDGIAPVPEIDAEVRATVRGMPVEEAYAALMREDAPAAARLAPADSARTMRALEVIRSTGRSILDWRTEKSGGIGDVVDLHPLILLPPRERLYARCDARFEAMLDQGAIDEVEALLARNLAPDLPVMRAIGVPEIAGWLMGKMSREAMIAQAQAATRQYAKRQYTWFSRQPPAHWPRRSDIYNNNDNNIVIKLFKELLT
ncbi:tRNA (adenosine(37)-N6)-dimethylallyltransferase MiaA [Sphingobium fluviale]|uniref:tRNA dimethylallyltransferase n=1 Tax=Sphingobium fluviale TaxID=2506423 RepID=A0A4Q1KFL3_9SPHN|nr:tRNA (adenosine(37)-N6)-dimethylallyltransferase MiaA [Sphingobium fluviale]RXR27582.1 tRNA (adenosine(37)-N6)-dimethylallyltransferase MiaA [Sphingobium fluviale]